MADNGLLAFAQAIFGGSVGTDEGKVVNDAMARLALAITSVGSTGQISWAKGVTMAPINVTGTTLTLSAATHDHHPVTISSAAGCTVTLPAATGSGAVFWLFIATTLTSSSFVVQVANANDYMRGAGYTSSGATASTFATANTGTVSTESDTLTMNRTTTGLGTQGDFVEIIDIAANLWSVEADYTSSGTAATPFSAAV